jgi:hypothetical protein
VRIPALIEENYYAPLHQECDNDKDRLGIEGRCNATDELRDWLKLKKGAGKRRSTERDFVRALISGYSLSDQDAPGSSHRTLFDLLAHAAYAVGYAFNSNPNAYIPATTGWKEERAWQDSLLQDPIEQALIRMIPSDKRMRVSLLAK